MAGKPIYAPAGFREQLRLLMMKLNHGALRDPRAVEYRRKIFKFEPLLFALYYFEDAMKSPQTGNRLSLSWFHIDFYTAAERWIRDDLLPGEIREAWIVARGGAKTTSFKIAGTWALAYGHRRFIAMFGNAAPDVQKNLLAGMTQQFARNERLRRDFPELCQPVVNRADMYVAESGAILTAMGMDTSSLGLNYNNFRPDEFFVDDPEPNAANYEATTKEKRLEVIESKILSMSPEAPLLWSCTTSVFGGLAHDLVRTATGEQPAGWVRELQIRPRYYPALVVGEDGLERSWWPERWTTEQLQEIRDRSPRVFAKDFANNPKDANSNYWRPDLFVHSQRRRLERLELWIDPAVTSKRTSDYTALAVLGLDVSGRVVVVLFARGYHFTPEQTLSKVEQILQGEPRIRDVYPEDNQGKDWLTGPLRARVERLGRKLHPFHSTLSKPARMEAGLYRYEQRQVEHWVKHPALEEQMLAYNPTAKGQHDDLADVVCTGVTHMLGDWK